MSILTRPRPPRHDDRSDAEAPEALIEEARRRTRRRRRGYAACARVSAAAGLLAFYGFNHGGGGTLAQDGGGPASGQATNVFAQVRGWIVYTDEISDQNMVYGQVTCADNPGCADEYGIWAVDPTRPAGEASDRVQLRETGATPLDWSDDGTKLLISEQNKSGGRLVILNADGTETRVLRMLRSRAYLTGASLSPDGSRVVYGRIGSGRGGELRGAGIYVIDTDGGVGRPRLLKKAGHRQWYGRPENRWYRTELYGPAFSPDGTKIAYLNGMGDWGNGLRVMDADGSHVRVLLEHGSFADGIIGGALTSCSDGPVWSPDGSRLAFCGPDGIWVIGADGSGLRKVIPNGENPSWSPDGSRIAYQVRGPVSLGPLRIADADGGNVQKFTWGNSGPWNPLAPAAD